MHPYKLTIIHCGLPSAKDYILRTFTGVTALEGDAAATITRCIKSSGEPGWEEKIGQLIGEARGLAHDLDLPIKISIDDIVTFEIVSEV